MKNWQTHNVSLSSISVGWYFVPLVLCLSYDLSSQTLSIRPWPKISTLYSLVASSQSLGRRLHVLGYSAACKTWSVCEYAGNLKIWVELGPVIRVAPNMYSLDSLEAARIIYSTTAPLAKANYFRAFGFPLDRNHNLFSAQDIKVHAQMRRMVANFYSMTTIKSYESYVNDCISALLTQFDKMATQGDSVNLQHWMQCYAFDVIGQLTVGIGWHDYPRSTNIHTKV